MPASRSPSRDELHPEVCPAADEDIDGVLVMPIDVTCLICCWGDTLTWVPSMHPMTLGIWAISWKRRDCCKGSPKVMVSASRVSTMAAATSLTTRQTDDLESPWESRTVWYTASLPAHRRKQRTCC